MRYLIIFIIFCFLEITNVFAMTESEINNLIDKTNSLIDKQKEYEDLNKRYPIGSIYISINNTNPSNLFGGTWESYAGGRKLIAIGSNGKTSYTNVNEAGGKKTITLNSSNLPPHTHSLTPSGTVTSSFTGKTATTSSNGTHTHTMPFGKASDEAKGYGLMKVGYGNKPTYNNRSLITNHTNDDMSTAGAHTHSLTPSGTVTSTFTGNTDITSTNGSAGSIDIINPYITVYMWKRVS